MTHAALRKTHQKNQAAWENDLPLHFGSIEQEYRSLRESAAWLDFSAETKLTFAGEDRKGWLQGQVTNDLRNLDSGAFVEACLLNPTGQIIADMDFWGLDDSIVSLSPLMQHEATKTRLNQMLILEDVQITDLTSTHGIISVQGPEASAALSEAFTLPRLEAGFAETKSGRLILLRHDRTGSGGWDILFPVESANDVVKMVKSIKPAGMAAWNIARIESGFPLFGQDMTNRTLAMELGRQFIDRNISFNKGCYTGQEVVMRIHARGHTNRTWVGLIGSGDMPVGASIGHPERKDAGEVTSAALSPELGPIASAMLRVEVARSGEIVKIGDVEAEVVPMPLLRL